MWYVKLPLGFKNVNQKENGVRAIVQLMWGTEQNRTEQNRTEQNKTEQNRTEQNKTEHAEVNLSCWHSICHKPHINCSGFQTGSPQPEAGY
jgi:hypothetical protein